MWDENSELYKECSYKDGKKTGVEKHWSANKCRVNKVLVLECNYKDSKLNGTFGYK
jgi:antitoxin component YwqK of YwqJK toxin-antitoxin module